MRSGTQPGSLPQTLANPAEAPGAIVWFTGLSGAGKTTLCRCVAHAFTQPGRVPLVLDGDEVRATLSPELGFTRPDREENMRRLAALASSHARTGAVVLVAAIAPYRSLRDHIRATSPVSFLEVFVDAPLAVCEARDPKGLYRRARAGAIRRFTGIDDPYEPPLQPEVHCRTESETVEQSCSKVTSALTRALAWPRPAFAVPAPPPAADTQAADTLQPPPLRVP